MEPDLERPYRTPFYPLFPLVALVIAVFSLITMTYFNINRANPWKSYSLWYYGYLVAAFGYYFLFVRGRLSEEDVAHFQRVD